MTRGRSGPRTVLLAVLALVVPLLVLALAPVPASAAAADVKVNFQAATSPVPSGYLRDSGDAYATRTGSGQGTGRVYGWVTDGTTTPLDVRANARTRTSGLTTTDPRLASFVHMQYPAGGTTGVSTPAAWELAVPAGSYTVTVAVGDGGAAVDSSHQVNVEGQNAVARFVPTTSQRSLTVTRTVHVSDGRLTLSPRGGTNTKLDYVDVTALPATPVRTRVASVVPGNLTAAVTASGTTVSAPLAVGAAAVDVATATATTVRLSRVADGTVVPASVSVTSGGTGLQLRAGVTLATTSLYRFDVTTGVKDTAGVSLEPWSSVFTTGSATPGSAPAAPTGLRATAGESTVSLSWNAGTETDLAGYAVYRGPSAPVATSGTPLSGSALLTTTAYTDATVQPGHGYAYVVVARSLSGATSAPSSSATVTVPALPAAVAVKVNFSDGATAPPTGYVRDQGQAYGLRTGASQGSGLTYGWVGDSSGAPLDVQANARVRTTGTTTTDVRLNSFIHMQYAGSPTSGVTTPAAWELAVPSGSYVVTVAVGDGSGSTDSRHQLNVEDQNAVAQFVPGGTTRWATATRTVHVSDGRLTLTARGGTNTKLDYVDVASLPASPARPRVSAVSPTNVSSGEALDGSVTAELALTAAGGLQTSTVTPTNVRLTRVADGIGVPVEVNTSGGGDVVVLTPSTALAAGTSYRFSVSASVLDVSGAALQPWSSIFRTGASSAGTGLAGVAFRQAATTAQGQSFTSVTVGPDHRLYAGTLDGWVYRFPIGPDGDLGVPQAIDTVRRLNGGADRTVVGLAFDPASTASDLTLWVTDNAPYVGVDDVPDWSDKVDRLRGPDLATGQTVLVGLPRSNRDHETNSIAFGPDGALYLTQGSNTAMGQPDAAWGDRVEHVLSAAVLRLDTAALPAQLPLDVKTEEGGTYDPFAPGAALTVWASGLRNAFDLVWASNGSLYAPTNGSAANGNTPASTDPLPAACASRVDTPVRGPWTGPAVPALVPDPAAEPDWVFNVHRGGYYGHPVPARCEWTLNGGNPTTAADPFEVTAYPPGTLPDRAYRPQDVFDVGLHASADGAVEYRGSAFGGALDGKLLVTRYSAGQDLMVLDVGGTGGAVRSMTTGVTGLSGLQQPLDVTEDRASGCLYVSELGGQRITRLVPS